MILCDVCQTRVDKKEDLYTVSKTYETETIKHICKDCNDVLVKIFVSVRAQVNALETSASKRGFTSFVKWMRSKN